MRRTITMLKSPSQLAEKTLEELRGLGDGVLDVR